LFTRKDVEIGYFRQGLYIMQRKYFGTDGIRGRSNTGTITPEIMIKLARATSLACDFLGKKPTIVIGKDTRLSGYMLEFALTSGFISMGANIVLVGPIPTPAISMLVQSLRADLGMMISASHNPYYDNGVKFFTSSGHKISSELENKIEQLMKTELSEYVAGYDDLGKAVKLEDARGRYIEHVKYSFPGKLKLDGIKIVIDCANGAAWDIAPKVFHELGAEVISCGISPNGFNINQECGVMDPQVVASEVLKHKADLGIALDGDADRVLIVDENGKVINGDQVIAALADYSLQSGTLKNNFVVTTILSNMGLGLYLKTIGLDLIRTNVGDKYVVEKMTELGCNLGGEPSGHIITGPNQATGDGIKAALGVLAMYKEAKNIPISHLLNKFTPVPQYTRNIKYDHNHFSQFTASGDEKIKTLARSYQERYKDDARIIIRPSGTEPIIRLMIESKNEALAQRLLKEIEREVEKVSSF
jgi:phosphoglucosamine mutase